MSDQPVARPLPKHMTTQTENKLIHTKHPCLSWDSNQIISAFERSKAVHALDRAATVTGNATSLGKVIKEDVRQ
jgi:hypothetical protein